MLINSPTEMSVSHMHWVNIVMLKYYSFSDRLFTGYQKLCMWNSRRSLRYCVIYFITTSKWILWNYFYFQRPWPFKESRTSRVRTETCKCDCILISKPWTNIWAEISIYSNVFKLNYLQMLSLLSIYYREGIA